MCVVVTATCVVTVAAAGWRSGVVVVVRVVVACVVVTATCVVVAAAGWRRVGGDDAVERATTWRSAGIPSTQCQHVAAETAQDHGHHERRTTTMTHGLY